MFKKIMKDQFLLPLQPHQFL